MTRICIRCRAEIGGGGGGNVDALMPNTTLPCLPCPDHPVGHPYRARDLFLLSGLLRIGTAWAAAMAGRLRLRDVDGGCKGADTSLPLYTGRFGCSAHVTLLATCSLVPLPMFLLQLPYSLDSLTACTLNPHRGVCKRTSVPSCSALTEIPTSSFVNLTSRPTSWCVNPPPSVGKSSTAAPLARPVGSLPSIFKSLSVNAAPRIAGTAIALSNVTGCGAAAFASSNACEKRWCQRYTLGKINSEMMSRGGVRLVMIHSIAQKPVIASQPDDTLDSPSGRLSPSRSASEGFSVAPIHFLESCKSDSRMPKHSLTCTNPSGRDFIASSSVQFGP